MKYRGRGLFFFAVLYLLGSNALFATDVVLIIRSASPRDLVDRVWDPFASKNLGNLIQRLDPTVEVRMLQIAEGERLSRFIPQHIDGDRGEKLRGVIPVGHGSEDSFVFSGFGAYSPTRLAQDLLAAFRMTPLSEQLLVYLYACTTFKSPAENTADTGVETVLARELSQLVMSENHRSGDEIVVPQESPQGVKRIHLMGHRGVAGFVGWLPPFGSDRILKKLRAQPVTIPQSTIVSQYFWIGMGSLLLALQGVDAAGVGGTESLSVLLGVPSAALFLKTLFWHHVSKRGRLLVLEPTKSMVDRDHYIRAALEEAFRPISDCNSDLAQVDARKG